MTSRSINYDAVGEHRRLAAIVTSRSINNDAVGEHRRLAQRHGHASTIIFDGNGTVIEVVN